MSDAGEGLIDADSRILERMEEQQQSRSEAKRAKPKIDPEKARALESLRLAKTEMQRQLTATAHTARRDQIQLAIAELDRRLAEMSSP
jgi:hypothetical protein